MRYCFVGLGNPGGEYERTYHNVGAFLARALAADTLHDNDDVRVYEPRVFMNESGPAVLSWLRMQGSVLGSAFIIHDDSDLPLGSFKLSRGGGSAGHKGVESIIATAGTEDFWRARIGIRNPSEQHRRKAGDFVLTRWSEAEEELFVGLVPELWKAISGSLSSSQEKV